MSFKWRPGQRWNKTKAKQFPEPGWVYILRIVEHDGPVKIGRTLRFPFERSRQISNSIPFETSNVAFRYVSDAPDLESRIHAEYEHRRIKGEWFQLEQEELEQLIEHHCFFDEERAKLLDAEQTKEWRDEAEREKTASRHRQYYGRDYQ